MSGTNAFVTFHLDDFEIHQDGLFPKSSLLKFAINPFNGLVVMSYQSHSDALAVLDSLYRQVVSNVDDLSDFTSRDCGLSDFVSYLKGDIAMDKFDPCPFCGCEPVYDSGQIVCCEGRLVRAGYSTLHDAVRDWNNRFYSVRKAS